MTLDVLVDDRSMQRYGGPAAIDRWFWIDGLNPSLRYHARMSTRLHVGDLDARACESN